MNTTPIYAELQQTVMDPETTDWDVSSPPAFAAELTEAVHRHAAAEPATDDKESPGQTDSSGSKRAGRGLSSRPHGDNHSDSARTQANTATPAGRSRNRRHRADT